MKTLKKSYNQGICIILFALIASCSSINNHNNQKILVDIKGVIDSTLIRAGSGVSVSLTDIGNEKAIKMECNGLNPVPKITFKEAKDKWSLSKFRYVAADITNPGKADLFVECRPEEMGWLGGGQIIPAGKTRTVRAYILLSDEYPSYLDKKLYGMDALPGGIIKSFWWASVHADSIHKLSIVLIDPPKNSTILISNIRGEGSINPPAEAELDGNYFPLLDEFGQLKKKDWKGKIHSLTELIKSRETEKKDMITFSAPGDWNKWGGWLEGPQLKATGHFRTEKVDGKWWLVDPDGRLFWSHGIGSINMGNSTPISGREHYFTDLPDSVEFREFYSKSSRIPKGFYKGDTVKLFKSYAWNLYRKYGSDWESEYENLAHIRLKSWGMNTIGNFSSPDIVALRLTAYTGTLSSNSARRIEASEGPWTKFPDPFDKSFIKALNASVERIEKSASDPYCVGYFVDNELFWGDDSYIAKAVIQSPGNQPAKVVMCNYLKKKYRTIAVLNSTWHTSYIDWDDFLENKQLPEQEIYDTRIFSKIVADEYFRIVKETLTKSAPQKLYLGCRFDFHYYPTEDTTCNWAVKIAAKYCDVVSFNRYRYTAGDLRPADADKPVMIGEWHMGALDRGMLHFSLRFAENQENRAEMYEYYINSCLQNPYVIGAHWFQFSDQPVLGRADGEDLNTGFLDYCDIPYPEMVAISRKIGKNMYEIRSSKQSN